MTVAIDVRTQQSLLATSQCPVNYGGICPLEVHSPQTHGNDETAKSCKRRPPLPLSVSNACSDSNDRLTQHDNHKQTKSLIHVRNLSGNRPNCGIGDWSVTYFNNQGNTPK